VLNCRLPGQFRDAGVKEDSENWVDQTRNEAVCMQIDG
jgi:hypothetical protein